MALRPGGPRPRLRGAMRPQSFPRLFARRASHPPASGTVGTPEDFRLLVQGLRDFAVVMLDPKGFVRTWNAGATRLHGWAEQEILGGHCSRFYRPADAVAGKPARDLEAARTRSRLEEEGVRVRRDGSHYRAKVVITPIADDRGLRGYATLVRELASGVAQRSQRVLIVDDDAEGRALLADGMHLAGHEVSLTADGHSALAVLDQFGPDVVVLDLALPRLDAYEVARRIRARRPSRAKPRILAVTDHASAASGERSRLAGIEAQYVQPRELLRLLDHLGAPPGA